MEFKFLDIERSAKPKLTLLEQAGVAPAAIAYLGLPEAKEFAHDLLKARMRLNHPDRGGDPEKMKVFSGLDGDINDDEKFIPDSLEAAVTARRFENVLKRLVPDPGMPYPGSPEPLPPVLEILHMPNPSTAVDWAFLNSAEIVCLHPKIYSKIVNSYLYPHIALERERAREEKRRVKAPAEDDPELKGQINHQMTVAIELPLEKKALFVSRLLHDFFERYKPDFAELAREVRKQVVLKSRTDFYRAMLNYEDVYVKWVEYGHSRIGEPLSGKELAQMRREAQVSLRGRDEAEFERKMREAKELAEIRAANGPPKEVVEAAVEASRFTVSIDERGYVRRPDSAGRIGEMILGMSMFQLNEMEAWVTEELQQSSYKNAPLSTFGDLQAISDREEDEQFGLRRKEGIGEFNSVSWDELISFSRSNDIRPRDYFDREEFSQQGRVIFFDNREPRKYLISVQATDKGRFELRQLGLLHSITFLQPEKPPANLAKPE